jgi:hypothetical protein
MPNPIFLGLQSADGVWLSIIGGWSSGEQASLLFQLNHDGAEYDGASLSTTLRSHFLEMLVERGVRVVKVLGGCGGILQRFCRPDEYQVITLRKPGWRSHVFLLEERLRVFAARSLGRLLSTYGL